MCVVDVCISVHDKGVTPGNTQHYTGNELMAMCGTEGS